MYLIMIDETLNKFDININIALNEKHSYIINVTINLVTINNNIIMWYYNIFIWSNEYKKFKLKSYTCIISNRKTLIT